MTLLASGVRPFVERRLLAVDGTGWLAKAQATIGERRELMPDDLSDVSRLCGLLLGRWRDAFEDLGNDTRALVFEIRDARNRWAHQQDFADRDVLRLVDSAQRLLEAVKAPEERELEAMHAELRERGSGKRLVVTVAIAALLVAVVTWIVRLRNEMPNELPASEVAAVASTRGPDVLHEPAPPQADAANLSIQPSGSMPDIGRATVCGRVVRTHWARESQGAPTFIDLEDARSRDIIVVVVWGDVRDAFVAVLGEPPESAYRGRSVCASGEWAEYRGRAQVNVAAPSDIVIDAGAAPALTATEETCGDVVRAHWASASKGKPAFITLDVAGRAELVTLVVWEPLRAPFLARFGRNPEDLAAGSRVCVAAPVETYQGRPRLEPASVDAVRLPPPER